MLEICAFVNCCFVCSVIFIEYHSTMHCNKVLQACRYIAIYLGLPSECQYMACRLTSDIFTKECQHYSLHPVLPPRLCIILHSQAPPSPQLCQFNLLVNLLGKGASYPTWRLRFWLWGGHQPQKESESQSSRLFLPSTRQAWFSPFSPQSLSTSFSCKPHWYHHLLPLFSPTPTKSDTSYSSPRLGIWAVCYQDQNLSFLVEVPRYKPG